MSNKKLMVFNIIILCTIVGIMSIGYRTWGTTQQMKEESVIAGERIENEQEQIMELPLLKNTFEKKKRKSDFDLLIQEEVEIIELDDTEAEELPILDQINNQDISVEQTNSMNIEDAGNQQHESSSTSSTSVKEKSPIHNQTIEEPQDNTNDTSPTKEHDHLDEDEREDTQQLEEDHPEQPDDSDDDPDDPDVGQEETELEAESRVNNESSSKE